MNPQAMKTIDLDAGTGDAPTKPGSIVILPETAHAVTPWDLLARAQQQNADLPTLKEFMDLGERYDKMLARKAFNEAFANFKSEAITVVRNRKVTDGPLKGKRYAELVSFVEAATPALSAHGLSASWSITRDEKDWIEVTCTIEHFLGGSKQVSLGGPPDTGGAKNALQARISTVTYLERATFKAACGLAEQGDDDDGGMAPASSGPITEKHAEQVKSLIVEAGADLPKFLAKFEIAKVEELPRAQFDRAVSLLKAKIAKEAKEPAS